MGGSVECGTAVKLGRRTDLTSLLVGSDVCAVQHALKDSLDPLHLFNPGKA